MKKFLILMLFLYTVPVLAQSTIFEAHDDGITVVKTSNIVGAACYCGNSGVFDPMFIRLYGTNISRLYYSNRNDCYKDYDRFKDILKQNAYAECVKHGGGNACKSCL